jgi:hypothetical protein
MLAPVLLFMLSSLSLSVGHCCPHREGPRGRSIVGAPKRERERERERKRERVRKREREREREREERERER